MNIFCFRGLNKLIQDKKMNEIVNKFLLVGDKFMPTPHRGKFTKNKKRVQKLEETRDSRYIYQNEIDKANFNVTWLMEILTLKRLVCQF